MSEHRKLALIWVLLAWLISCGLIYLPIWQTVESKLFDLASIATAPRKSMLPITIVSIDEASFTQIGEQWPWPRALHARLIDKLILDGAAVIAFDVMFSEKSDPPNDQALADAIGGTLGAVVLSADHAYHETALVRQWLRVDPLAEFILAGATSGLTTMSLDTDGVARQFPVQPDAFWRQVIRTLIMMRPGIIEEPDVPNGAMIRYLGPVNTFPHVSYYQVLNEDSSIPQGFFQDQIVLIGRNVRSSVESGAAQADMFATPFILESGYLTPGVEIQATLIENALMGLAAIPVSRAQAIMSLTFTSIIVLPVLVWWHLIRSAALISIIAMLSVITSLWLLDKHNSWLPYGSSLIALFIMYLGMGVSSYFVERRRASGIKKAFSKYVSSAVVEEMVSHKDKLRLGGEKRILTILFSDLAGFTSLSEQLEPEEVAHLMNLYLTEMTRVIHSYGGTVDKFIGDAVMAFWNAPLEESDHALKAVQAAVTMRSALIAMQPKLNAIGVNELSMRIGLHTGPTIVGNMGSEERFDYTAIGDTVNLASRLEGVNKYYGTDILLSESTASLLDDQISLRPVDLVKVKGKKEAVSIYTPCNNYDLIGATQYAFSEYQAQHWQKAKAAWEEVHSIVEGDSLANVFLSRIEKYRDEHPDGDWDGSTALEK